MQTNAFSTFLNLCQIPDAKITWGMAGWRLQQILDLLYQYGDRRGKAFIIKITVFTAKPTRYSDCVTKIKDVTPIVSVVASGHFLSINSLIYTIISFKHVFRIKFHFHKQL